MAIFSKHPAISSVNNTEALTESISCVPLVDKHHPSARSAASFHPLEGECLDIHWQIVKAHPCPRSFDIYRTSWAETETKLSIILLSPSLYASDSGQFPHPTRRCLPTHYRRLLGWRVRGQARPQYPLGCSADDDDDHIIMMIMIRRPPACEYNRMHSVIACVLLRTYRGRFLMGPLPDWNLMPQNEREAVVLV